MCEDWKTVLAAGFVTGLGGVAIAEPTPVDLETAIFESVVPGSQLIEIDMTGEGEGDVSFLTLEILPGMATAGVGVINQGLDLAEEISQTFPNINDPNGDPPTPVVLPVPRDQSVRAYVEAYQAGTEYPYADAALTADFPTFGINRPPFDASFITSDPFYLGVELGDRNDPAGPVRYGWVLVQLRWSDHPIEEAWEILAAAYESTPNTDLLAGAGGPSCAADFNGDGTANVNDLLGYLGTYRAGSAAADIDGTPGVSVGDLLAFLGAYRAGC